MPADITATLAILVGGVDASTFEDRGDQYQVFLRAAERFRNDPSALSLIAVPSRSLGQVPLSDVIKVRAGKAISKITRQSRERAVTITMNNSPGFSESDIVAELEKTIKALQHAAGLHGRARSGAARRSPSSSRRSCSRSAWRSSSCTWCSRRSSSPGCTR